MAKSKRGKTICLFSAKGGVGKTITTLNLAGVYASIGKRVLIIDLDLAGGGIALAMNVQYEKNIFNMSEDLNNKRYNEFSDYVTKYNEQIDFIASPKDPRQMSKMDSKYIDLIIEKASFLYDVILIDTNHFLSEINLITLDKVDKILFIFTNDPLDLKNLKSLLSIFKDNGITKHKLLLNQSRDPYKLYFSEADIRNILKTDIDYILSERFYIKDIDTYLMNGKIVTLNPKVPTIFMKDYPILMSIATDMLLGGE